MEDIRMLPCSIGTRAIHSDLPEEDDEKYYIRIRASNAELDKHHSMMDPDTTLKNFEADAKSELGVALKDHHGSYSKSFGYGRSIEAMLTKENELLVDFFILKNMDYHKESSFHFTSSEQLIRAIENGLVNQASVGFYDAREICNLCNLPIRKGYWYDYWEDAPAKEGTCSHKMGKEYETSKGTMQVATYTIFDAHLKEISLVEFGSNRKTSIDKREFDQLSEYLDRRFATELAKFKGDDFKMKDAEWISGIRTALNLPDLGPSDDPEKFLEALTTEASNLREPDAERNKQHVISLRDALGLKDVRSTDDLGTVIGKAKTEIEGIRETVETQRDEIADLQDSAKDGKAHREARVEEAIKQGNRAYGDDFDEAYHREYYSDMPLEQLEKHIAQNKKKGDAALPAGRSTSDDHEPPPEKNKRTPRQRKQKRRWR